MEVEVILVFQELLIQVVAAVAQAAHIKEDHSTQLVEMVVLA
jgi:hypothetical protein